MSLILADVSEWQGTVDWAAYAAGGYPAAVARLTYGADHVDRQAANNMTGMRAHLALRGFYGYVVADQDAAAQGQAFAAVLQHLERGEWVCADVEEGTGDQEPRAAAWLDAVNTALGVGANRDMQYSGLSFVQTHGGWVPGVTRWVAAYNQAQPQVGETLWQYTDQHTFPGISGAADASIFNGTAAHLAALVGGETPPDPNPSSDEEETMIVVRNLSTGAEALCDGVSKVYLSKPVTVSNLTAAGIKVVDVDPADFDAIPNAA